MESLHVVLESLLLAEEVGSAGGVLADHIRCGEIERFVNRRGEFAVIEEVSEIVRHLLDRIAVAAIGEEVQRETVIFEGAPDCKTPSL